MSNTKIVLNQQSDLILNNATIIGASGIEKSDLPGLVDDLGALSSSIEAEETARISGDAELSSEISVERGRIDAILQGADVDLNQFKEVVDFVESIDLTNDNALLAAVTAINSDIEAEEARALAAEAALSADLTDLQSYVDTTVDSAIATLTSDLADETAARIADVDAEEARALAAEGILQTNINTEANERAAEDITLQGNIDIEVARAEAAEAAIAADLGAETAARIAAVSAEETRATAAEVKLTSDLAAEVTRATAAEGVLQSSIDVEKGRIDAILIGASADADNFAEIVALINSVDTTNDQAFASYVLSNDAALAAEVARAESAEADLTSDLAAEVLRAEAAEGVLTSDLAAEVARAEAAEATLTSAVSAEEASRIAGDASLQSSLNNEIADRIAADQSMVSAYQAADTTLQANIDTEKARIDAILDGSDVNLDQFAEVVAFVQSIDMTNDDALLTAVNAINSSIDAEEARALAAEAALSADLTDLQSYVDTTVDSAIATLTSDLADETAARIADVDAEEARALAAEAQLTSDLESEIDRATLAEQSLRSDLDAEIAARIAADDELEVKISDIIANTDLTAVDSFAEVVRDLSAEIERAEMAESQLASDLAAEVSAREAAIAEEHAHHTAAEELLTTNLDAEVVRATAAEEALDAAKLDLAGGTMSGAIDMGGNNINGVDTIYTSYLDSTTSQIYLSKPIDAKNSHKITSLPAPTDAGDATNKEYVDAGDATLQSNLDAAIAQEVADRTAAIEAANTDLTTESQERVYNDAILQSQINDLAFVDGDTIDVNYADKTIRLKDVVAAPDSGVRFFEGDIKVGVQPDTQPTYDERSLITKDIMDRRLEEEVGSINSSIENEIARAQAKESELEASLDVEKARIDAILDASDADKDSFAEIVQLINSVDTENDQAFASYVLSNNDALNSEIAERLRLTNILGDGLVSEQSAREDGDAAIQNEINNLPRTDGKTIDIDYSDNTIKLKDFIETTDSGVRVFEGDLKASSQPSDLNTFDGLSYITKDYVDNKVGTDLTAAIQAEEDARTQADAALQSLLDTEVADRIADVDAEEARALAAEAALSADLADLQSYVDTTVDSAIATLTSDLADETAARIADVDAEEARALAAEAALSADLADLQSYVDTTVDSAIATLTSDLADETAARIADVDAEEARALAAEGVLQSNIDYEKSRIDAILIGASADADNFAEIVALINSVDTTNDTAFASYVLSNDAALADETAARIADVDAEEARALAAEAALSTDLTDLQSYVDTTVDSAIATLTSDLADETAARIADVDAEETRALAAEGVLQSNIDTEKARIDAILIGASASADNFAEIVQLINSVDTTNDTAFASYVLSNDAALAAETAARIADVDAEETRALAAEAALATDIANIYSKKVSVVESSNGTITTFNLAKSVRIGSEMIYVNGLLMEEGDDYSTIVASGKVSGVQFFTAPLSNMKVRAYGVYGI